MNEILTAILVEDEEMPRLALLYKLETYHPGIRVVDSCDNCDDALESILKHRPDVLFLDIALPEKNSLWLINQLREISTIPLPHIIFTTAFNDSEYLMNAIKIEAVDYLLKPVNLKDLADAIRKVHRRISERKDVRTEKPEKVEKAEKEFTFRSKNGIIHLKETDIVYCRANGNSSVIYLANGEKEHVFENLLELEHRVCQNQIIRASRQYILNTAYIHKIDPKSNVCQFLLPKNTKVNITLSSKGMETVKKRMD
jgi:DNA-binding LytR/AlgR family response regulator